MRKIVALVVIALFCLSVPLAVQADKAGVFQALEAKLLAALDADRSISQAGGYQYAQVFAYTQVDGTRWTGLAVYNFSGAANEFLVGCYDSEGQAACTGNFSLGPNGSMVANLQDFMTDGTVPANGSVGIFGTQMFYGNVFVGNRVGGGFGEIEKAAEPY